MEYTQKHHEERDAIFHAGLGLILLTLSTYLLLLFNKNQQDLFGSIIFINYFITVCYFLVMVGDTVKRTKRIFAFPNRYQYICLMTLATISCLTLNVEVNVFDQFSTWVNIYMMVMYSTLLAVCFFDKLSYKMRIPIFFGLGLGTAMAAYFTIYLLPMMPFGLALFFLLGLPLHLIVPLLVLLNFVTVFVRTEKTTQEKQAYGIGIVVPLVLVALFIGQWESTSQTIRESYYQQKTGSPYALPAWVKIGQQLSDGFFTQRILKGDLVYTTFASSSWFDFDLPMNSFNEKKEHDPLVAIASAYSGELPIRAKDRINILKFYGNSRHDTHRKLWSGKHLKTTNIKTKVQVYPEFRLAYTEKIITIKNEHRWRQEEALYTFELPEGSVATSLSLWINGVEEPSRLTTRGKADSAYVSIVGVERRDPALLHWQEGNTITVTVFPCTSKEDRIFKIGITSPMRLEDNELYLDAISFDGPSNFYAKTSTQVSFPTQPQSTYDIDYSGNLNCPAPPLSTQHFSFEGQTFWMENYQPEMESFDPKYIYLDINKSWTSDDFKSVTSLFEDKEIYAFVDAELVLVDASFNFEAQAKLNYSLFPISSIKYPERSLLISKSSTKSPNLSDLEKTPFGKSLLNTLQERPSPLRLFSLSAKPSPYLQSLKEFYVFNYMQGSIQDLIKLDRMQVFPALHPSNNSIVFHQAQTTIFSQNNKQNFQSKAPDHLMRLFAYNQILKKIGVGYFKSGYENQELVDIANQAYVVSPISSLIVLETQKDYERFDIEENENSLGNANKKGLKKATSGNSGSVPEPHEWCFIILSILGLLSLYLKKGRLF